MTLDQHIAANKAKNARRWTVTAATSLKIGLSYPRNSRHLWPWVENAARIVRDHSRRPETRAEARKLLAILEAR